MSRATILFMDNLADFLDIRTRFLERAGYHVLKAYTLDQAHELLENAHANLMVLDIRMVDDEDENDISGLTLARNPAYRPLPKIVLTGFPHLSTAREALRSVDGGPLAKDYLDKDKEPDEMVQDIHRIFQEIRINFDLHISWGQCQIPSFLCLAGLLGQNLPNEVLVHRADELEDLFRHLFYKYHRIQIGRLFWHDEGRFCMLVLAQSPHRVIDVRIVVCGERNSLTHEVRQVQTLAPKSTQQTELVTKEETIHFGAALYALPGLTVSQMRTLETLRDLFQPYKGAAQPVASAFQHLIEGTLSSWHARGQTVVTQDLMTLYRKQAGFERYGWTEAELDRRVDALIQALQPYDTVRVGREGSDIIFCFPLHEPLQCPDPVAVTHTVLNQAGLPTVCKASPGRLTADNVLVSSQNAEQQIWLTDFASAGQIPQWWDFACLEATARFDLGQIPDHLVLEDFERCLMDSSRLDASLDSLHSEMSNNIALIQQVRHQVCSQVDSNARPYYAGLLVWIMATIARGYPFRFFAKDEFIRGLHLLLAGAWTAKWLQSPPSITTDEALRMDQDETVWVGERRVDLSGNLLALFRLLYENAGKVVSLEDIAKHVYGIPFDKSLANGIYNLVRRLRRLIKPKDPNLDYILGLRERGYRLQLDGKRDH